MTVSRRLPRSMVVPAPISTSFWINTRPVCGTFRWPSGPKNTKPNPSCPMLQPGWIRTLLPISAHWMAERAPTLQSRPILTWAPITAPAPMTVPAPISIPGPIMASGSTVTSSSRRALGSMIADGAMPSIANQVCGRNASRCSSRATRTKAWNGWAARSTATSAGTRAAKRGLTRQAPALVAANWSTYFTLSKNVRCMGPASSSDARPRISCAALEGSSNCAFVNAAISSSVERGGRSKNVGCAMTPRRDPVRPGKPSFGSRGAARSPSLPVTLCGANLVSLRPETPLERCTAAKLELLHAVIRTLGERNRIVEAQRTKRRGPDQTDTHRRANDIAGGKHQTGAGSGKGRIDLRIRRNAIRIGRRGEFGRRSPCRRSLVVPQVAGVGIDGTLQTHFLRQEPERHLQFERRTPVLGAAQRVHRSERIDVARTDTVRSKAADQIRTHLEVIEHANLIVADLVQHPCLQVNKTDDVGNQRRIVLSVDLALQIGDVAADAGKVLPEVDQEAVGRVLVVVERVVVQCIADRRRQRRAVGEFLADRQRRFAIAIAKQAEARRIDRTERISAIGRHERRRRIECEEIVTDKGAADSVVTVRQIERQRDGLLVDRIAQLQHEIFAELEAEARTEADRLRAVRDEAVGQLLAIESVQTKRHSVIQQIRIDIGEREAACILSVGQCCFGEQPATKEVALGNADLAERAIRRGVTARHREVAGRFLLKIDDQNHTVARGARLGRDLHFLEVVEILQAPLGTV